MDDKNKLRLIRKVLNGGLTERLDGPFGTSRYGNPDDPYTLELGTDEIYHFKSEKKAKESFEAWKKSGYYKAKLYKNGKLLRANVLDEAAPYKLVIGNIIEYYEKKAEALKDFEAQKSSSAPWFIREKARKKDKIKLFERGRLIKEA